MDKKFPSYIYKLIAGAIAGVILASVIFALWGAIDINNKIKEGRYIGKSAQYQNSINVSGEGRVLASPDIGQVDLTVLSEAVTVAAAQKTNTDKMNKATQGIKDLGIKDADLKTTNYNINPNYQYTGGKSVIIGYQVSQTLRVKIRDLTKVGDVLDRATALGVNQVGSLNFTFNDPENLKAQARADAIANAEQKARALARELGVTLGNVVSFSESDNGLPTPIYYSAKDVGMGGGGTAPDVQTGQNEINITVNLAYEIY